MADSDGQVRIIIDTNADKAVAELNKTSKAFDKTGNSAYKTSTVYAEYHKQVSDNIEIMHEMTLGGMQNSESFKKLAEETRFYQSELNKANTTVNNAIGSFGQQNNAMNNLIGAAKKLAGAYISIQGIRAVINYSNQAVEVFRTQEIAILQLNQTLQNAGVYSFKYSQDVQRLASEIQSYSNYGDEAIIKAQALGQAYIGNTKITNDLTKAVVDFAAATGMDLENAFTLVGKSIGSNTNALGRYGIELKNGMSDSQKMETITKQLAERFNGSAANMSDASIQLKNALGDLSEQIGGVLNPIVEASQRIFTKATIALAEWIKKTRQAVNASDIKALETSLLYQQEQLKKATGNDKKIWEERIAQTKKYLTAQQAVFNQSTNITNKKPLKYNDDYGISNTSGSTTASVKNIKDAFEQAQEKAQQAEKAFKLALYKYGENSNVVEQARQKWVNTKKAVDEVQQAYERLTANGKTPFEQLNFNLQEAQNKLRNLASMDVVDLEKVKQAQTEVQQWQSKMDVVNQYLQPQIGAYQQLNDKVSSLTQKLRDLAAENQINSSMWEQYKTELQNAQAELDKVNKSLEDNGIKIEGVAKNISSTISSGLINALRTGGSAFDVFSNLATTALQKILDKLIEISIITPLINALTGGTGGGIGSIFSGFLKLFANANGNVFQNGNVVPFANGGVVNKPTIFPMANGGTGLMGEAGAEAVMPLRRMSNGRLGVESESNGQKGQVVNIYNYSGANVETRKRDDNTVDVFIRRVNDALANERTSSGFRSAYAREDRKGVQAV